MGSKQNLIPFIFDCLDEFSYNTVLDAFAGSSCMAYEFKRKNKKVTTNDFLHFSYTTAKALVENNNSIVDNATLAKLLAPRNDAARFIRDNYTDLFFTYEECTFLDALWLNIQDLENTYQKHLAMAAACRACQKKRPRGIFTVTGKKGWDHRRDLRISLQQQFIEAIHLFNSAVFDNGKENFAFWGDIMSLKAENFDLVYFDPPYWSPLSDNDYVRRYHFIEGYSLYWQNLKINAKTKSRKFNSYKSDFSKLNSSIEALKKLFNRYSNSIIAVSYSSNGYPTKEELIKMLRAVKHRVDVHETDHCYSFANQANKNLKNRVKEYLFIGRD